MPQVAKKLELTSKKQQKFDDLFVQSRRRMIDLKSNVEKEKLEVEMILDQQDFDESACMDRFKKFQDARTKLANELSKAVIRSPINGIVLTRNVEPGQTVAASLQAPVLLLSGVCVSGFQPS